MAINVKCPKPGCGKVLSVKDEYAGKTGKCPVCGTAVKVPMIKASPEAPAAKGPAKAPAPAPAPRPKAKAPPPPLDEDDVEEPYEPEEEGTYAKPVGGEKGILGNLGRANGLNKLDQILLVVGLVGLFLAAASTPLPWLSAPAMGPGGGGKGGGPPPSMTVSYLDFAKSGAILLVVGLVALGAVAATLFMKRFLTVALCVAAFFGTYGFLDALSFLITKGGPPPMPTGMPAEFAKEFIKAYKAVVSPSFGVFIGVLGTLAAAGTFGFLSLRHPTGRPGQGFLKKNLGFVIAEGLGVALGLLIFVVRL